MSSIKQKLCGFFDEIAINLGLMTKEQSVQNLTVQTRFLMLAEKDIKPTEKFLDADPLFEQVRDNWDGFVNKFGFTETDFMYDYSRAASGKGFDKEETPAIGKIAKALGNISGDVKNAILTAQAAVRSEQAILDMFDPISECKTEDEIQRQHGRIDYEGKFDPAELVAAQINNKAADELLALVKSPTHGVENSADKVEEIKSGTKKAYQDAANMFKELDIPAAKHIAQELNRAAQSMEKQK